MHIPEGFNKEGMGDIDVIAHKGVLHVFYLCIPSHDRVGHLTSTDGLNWKEEVAALHTGAPGAFDDDQIWTMGVFAHAGKFFMLYTGLAMKERGKVQRVGLATSEDLFTWTRHGNGPVAEADGRWYQAMIDARTRVDWRDPWVFSEDGKLHGVVTARLCDGPTPPGLRGCVGYMTSSDGYAWEVKPPLVVPGALYDFETVAIAKIAGRYYMTGIAGRDSAGAPPTIYRVAEKVDGPYRRIGHGEVLPANNQVFKPVIWKGKTLYFSHMRGIADWDGGCGVTALAPAKVAEAGPDGALVLRTFDGWSAVATGKTVVMNAIALEGAGTAVQGRWSLEGGELKGRAPVGVGIYWLEHEEQSMVMTARVRRGVAAEFGVMLRAKAGDDATYVSLTPSMRRVQLYVIQGFHKTPWAGVTYRWRGRRVVQEWVSDQEWGDVVELKVVAYGPYVEVSVNERVLISAITMARPGGRVGFFVEDGEIGVEGLELMRLGEPGRG